MCEFCDEIRSWKEKFGDDECIYGSQLYMYRKYKAGSLTSRPYDIKYCPMCGKRIASKEPIKEIRKGKLKGICIAGETYSIKDVLKLEIKDGIIGFNVVNGKEDEFLINIHIDAPFKSVRFLYEDE